MSPNVAPEHPWEWDGRKERAATLRKLLTVRSISWRRRVLNAAGTGPQPRPGLSLANPGRSLPFALGAGAGPSEPGWNGSAGWPFRNDPRTTDMFSFSSAICRPMAMSSATQVTLSSWKVLGGTW